MDLAERARELLDTGKRAFGGTLAGGAWMAWGLSARGNVSLLVTLGYVLALVLLLIACGYSMLRGIALRREHPYGRRPINRAFLLVIVLEATGAGVAINAAQRLQRPDALPDWVGIVIGLHFFGIARAFHAPVYYVTAIAITFWCLLSWALFHGDPLTVSAGLGTGLILWATSSFNLCRVLRTG